MNFDRIDLNLLRLLDALMEERSVSGVARRLAVSQPTVSNALNRLRTQLGDPLFVRSSDGMRPTAKALQLAQPVGDALTTLRDALRSSTVFDPSQSRRRFKILTIDLGETMLLPALLPALSEIAPNVSLATSALPYERYREALQSGEADLAVDRLPVGHRDFVQRTLWSEPWRCVMRKDHPRINGSVTMQQLMAEGHIELVAPGWRAPVIPGALGRQAENRRIVAQVSHYLSLPPVLEATDLVCVVPGSFSRYATSRFQLKAVPPPFRIRPPVVRQFWHKCMQNDAEHQWIRNLIAEKLRDYYQRASDNE